MAPTEAFHRQKKTFDKQAGRWGTRNMDSKGQHEEASAIVVTRLI